MIVRRLEDLRQTAREVLSPDGFTSRRLLLRDDGMGFTLTDTVIHPGTRLAMGYLNHAEACYCISGHGKIEATAERESFTIEPGTMYALAPGERHVLSAFDELRLICVFQPALAGPELHDADGSYPGQ